GLLEGGFDATSSVYQRDLPLTFPHGVPRLPPTSRSGATPAPSGRRGGPMRAAAFALKRRQWEPVAFASPALVLITVVIVFPLAYSFYLSLLNFDLSVGPEREFVGLKNYSEALFRDQRFLGSLWNTAVIIVPALILELLLGLGIALLLNRDIRGRPIITALIAIPAMVSPVMAGMGRPVLFGGEVGRLNHPRPQLGLLRRSL